MMSNVLRLILPLNVVLAMAQPVGAQDGAPAPGLYKIGVVNVKEVFDNYQKQKDDYEKLRSETDTKQSELDKLSEKITNDRERYEQNKANMTAAEKNTLEESITADADRYKAEFQRHQSEIDRKEKKLLEDVFDDIHKAVAEVGAQGDYHLVLEAGETGRSGVLYFSTPLNITWQVIDYLNAKYQKS